MNEIPFFELGEGKAFRQRALQLFREQVSEVQVYREFVEHLGVSVQSVDSLDRIPFLPVRFFKGRKVLRNGMSPELVFRSSGTSENERRAHHYVSDPALYDETCSRAFRQRYGSPSSYRILALLPSYAERGDASLVRMVKGLMEESGHPENGFFLYELEALCERLKALDEQGISSILIGVSFALLELAERFPMSLDHCIVMETGGMKGRRREMVREELHGHIKEAFDLDRVHSEFGMTELLSQAYAKRDGLFYPPPWMKVMAREIEDPFSFLPFGRTGALNVIDLANRDSCAFLALDDLGRVHGDGSFEVIGRLDGSDVRGCNLMWQG